MLGHLKPHTGNIAKEARKEYQNLYCSICASLRQENGLVYGSFINNELTLVLLALSPYFEKEEGKTPCPLTVFTKKNAFSKHPAIDKARDISVVLAWLKLIDWETDKELLFAKQFRTLIDKKAEKIFSNLSDELKDSLKKYKKVTQENDINFQKIQEFSGELSNLIFQEVSLLTNIPEENKNEISKLFYQAGKIIHQADALIDLVKDQRKNQYNPILEISKQSTLLENYQGFRTDFNRLRKKILNQINRLERLEIVSKNFVESFSKSIHQITGKVHKSKPKFLSNKYF